MGMKYIVLEIKNGDIKREWPIIFPDMLVHKHVATIMQFHLKHEHKQDSRVISAGSFSCFAGVISCTGESETLDVESRGIEDEKLINMFDYLHGIV